MNTKDMTKEEFSAWVNSAEWKRQFDNDLAIANENNRVQQEFVESNRFNEVVSLLGNQMLSLASRLPKSVTEQEFNHVVNYICEASIMTEVRGESSFTYNYKMGSLRVSIMYSNSLTSPGYVFVFSNKAINILL